MKFSQYVVAGLTVGTALAYPGMKNLMMELDELSKRQAPPNTTIEMIGDLVNGATTDVGNKVKACLEGTVTCEDFTPKTYVAPSKLSTACFKDTCCIWDYIQKDLVEMFSNKDGTCNDLARAAVRLGFHDAGAWSKTSKSGGADGSLVLSVSEINRAENNGMQAIRLKALVLLTRYALWGVSAADLVQFMHNVATIVCPLGPRTLTLVGRKSSFSANPTGLLPDTRASAQSLVDLFAAKTITFVDLIALIGAHTTAKQRFVDRSKAGQPLDSTPGVWDVKFYSEVLAPAPPAGVFRLPSDQSLVNNPQTRPGFGAFSNPTTGQAVWNNLYSKAYVRLSLLGVNNINKLTDCTKVLPNARTSFP